MPRRQPRKPSIGLNSCSSWTRCMIFSTGMLSLRARSICDSFEFGKNSCNGGSRKRIVARKTFQRPAKIPEEVVALIRQQFRERIFTHLDGVSENHFAHRVNAVALEEHVFGAREADAHGAECDGVLRLLRRVRVRADGQARGLGAPLHQLREALEFFRGLRRFIAANQTSNDF